MSTRILKSVTFAVLAAWSVLALAQTADRVGRIAVAEGQVTIAGELGEQTQRALVNWPVTSRNQVTTGRDARTEIRIGSTAIRLDADSALDVTELDDDSLRLHLHYGSASVRVRNPDLLDGFELSTPQGIIRMQNTGRLRVDAGRRHDTTMVSVFDGSAVVDGGGSRVIVRAGKRAEIGMDDIRTGRAMRDNFDDWAMLRDERAERSESVRYVHREMTGYEDLDEYGSWRQSSEYGPLWSPRSVPYGWAPYRDGRWTYLQPWGWTWVDNASWGYAPFHYGRWVTVDQRWYWAPGRNISRVVWSPALVGWVGGNNWNLSFTHRGGHRAMPAQGWYPLAPREAYVPSYRMSHDNLQYVNRHAANTQPDVRRRSGRPAYGQGDQQRLGLTVVPHEQFNQRGTVAVKGMASGLITTAALKAAPMAVAPPVPAAALAIRDRNHDGRPDSRAADQRAGRFERGADPAAPGRISIVNPPATSANPAAANAAPMAPSYGSAPVIRRESRFGSEDLQRDARTRTGDTRLLRMERPTSMPTPAPALPPEMDTPPPGTAATVISAPSQPLAAQPQPQPNDERLRGEREAARERLRARRESMQRDPDVERDRMVRGMEAYQRREPVIRPMPQVYQQMQQQVQPQPQRMAPPPVPMAQPQPQPQPQPMPMAQPQPQRMAPTPTPVAQPQPMAQPQPQQERREMRRLSEDTR